MFRVFIVDDEKQARTGLRDFMPWAALGCGVCGEADDGETALGPILDEKPDILLTDVRMKRMDGIELSRRVKQFLPDTQVIFISGYSDADYLQQALRMEAVDYVYKPVNLRELGRTIERVTGKLGERALEQDERRRMREQLEKSMPLLREKFFIDWFDGQYDQEQLREQMAFLQISLPQGPLLPVVLCLDRGRGDTPQEHEMSLLSLERLVRELFKAAVCARWQHALVALFSNADGSEAARRAEEIARQARTRGQSVWAGVADAPVEPDELCVGVRRARDAADRRFFEPDRPVFIWSEAEEAEGRKRPGAFDARRLALRVADGLETVQTLEAALRRAGQGRTIDQVRGACILLTQELCERCLCADISRRGVALCARIPEMDTQQALFGAVLAFAQLCVRVEKEAGAEQGDSVSAAVLKILQMRYAQRLTIEDLAREVHLSASYLSVRFKQETGETILDSLTRIRMEHARLLLERGELTVYQAAEAAGYTDAAYFTRMFKRTFGMTPAEYRRREVR